MARRLEPEDHTINRAFPAIGLSNTPVDEGMPNKTCCFVLEKSMGTQELVVFSVKITWGHHG